MGVKFKCKISGNIFEFQHEWDVEEMRKHPQYEEIEETVEVVPKLTPSKKKTKGEQS